MKKQPLSEAYYKSKRTLYISLLIFWLLFGVVITAINLITPKNIFEASLATVAFAISAIYSTRLDALTENYAIYLNNSEPAGGPYRENAR